MNRCTPQHVAQVLGDAPAVTILCHVRPDPDTIGSGLALGLGLSRRGAEVEVSFPGKETLPQTLTALPGAGLVVPADEVIGHPVVVSVDAATLGRLGDLGAVFERAERSVVVDHHVSNGGFGALNLIDPSADCTATLVLQILDALGIEIDADIATCVYAGLITDTGSFKWARPESLRVGARLLDAGVDGSVWSRALLDTHPVSWLSLVSKVLDGARFDARACAGRGVIYAVVAHDMLGPVGWADVESIIDVLRVAEEAEVAAVFKETAPGKWAVSLRAKDKVDLVPLAGAHGGGGHRRAAGYSDSGPAADVVKRFLESL
ncbi:bifunctional oligoribonuclease/PAP phosphatase NrnA [Gordonia pseudamarae]|uniref:Bifunctional oligoribonuclease/PAP phosphatase NrnA n=1 Tax=Gordonia pseudamarae TaxID=2831662 RepID=A0ABX6IGS1_9ACTN|nr:MULTISPECIES: DHH family phosphoesterase [Gordonia]MBD0020975.1 DHH family phosphoesterase [Gordonia sp. (in: high G+C Gram-positive bacteria)]QHN26180.1 bifunctional oligoribonuclease/PAP phosphatase NrnA [Gordonia pseudamarae]QHN35073.1 bifunctional oligoribonuclease/PAP phosphatase NrnA [Gordonia pseudamarae]